MYYHEPFGHDGLGSYPGVSENSPRIFCEKANSFWRPITFQYNKNPIFL